MRIQQVNEIMKESHLSRLDHERHAQENDLWSRARQIVSVGSSKVTEMFRHLMTRR